MLDGVIDFPPDAKGVLPDTQLARLIDARAIASGEAIPEENIQPASLDLRLGGVAYRLRASFLPNRREVARQLPNFVLGPPIDLSEGAILERGRPYLIPLQERLNLPGQLHARANPNLLDHLRRRGRRRL